MKHIEKMTTSDVKKLRHASNNDLFAIVFSVGVGLFMLYMLFVKGYIVDYDEVFVERFGDPKYVLAVIFLLAGGGLVKLLYTRKIDKSEQEKEVFIGPVEKEVLRQRGLGTTKSSHNAAERLYYLIIDDERFRVGKKTFRDTIRGDIYRISRSANSKYLLSVEKQ